MRKELIALLAPKSGALLSLGLLVWSVASSQPLQPRLVWLGTLGGSESSAAAVSANGVVVGWSYNSLRQARAFRWTPASGMQDLGALGGNDSWAYDVSWDGSVVVGATYNSANQARAYRWTAESGMRDLGTLGGASSAAYGVSADGATIVGFAQNVQGFPRASRWQNGAIQNLGTLGGVHSNAVSVSADGTVVVGTAQDARGRERAFRWTAQRGMEDLGALGGLFSWANDVSADGSVVVGYAPDSWGNDRAYRWTAETGMQDIGTLGGTHSWATAVSADGGTIVGASITAAGWQHAFRWRNGTMEDLNIVYARLISDGSRLWIAGDISPDGRYIVGRGQNAATGRFEAFVLDTIPEPGSVIILGNGIVGLLVALRRRCNRRPPEKHA